VANATLKTFGSKSEGFCYATERSPRTRESELHPIRGEGNEYGDSEKKVIETHGFRRVSSAKLAGRNGIPETKVVGKSQLGDLICLEVYKIAATRARRHPRQSEALGFREATRAAYPSA